MRFKRIAAVAREAVDAMGRVPYDAVKQAMVNHTPALAARYLTTIGGPGYCKAVIRFKTDRRMLRRWYHGPGQRG